VEVAAGGDGLVRVRDSKDPDGPVLLFPAAGWAAFLHGVASGTLRLAARGLRRPRRRLARSR
jgi:hypothetical protein